MSIKPPAHCDLGDHAHVSDGVEAIRCRPGVWYVAQVRWGGTALVSTVYRCSEASLQDTVMSTPDPLPDRTLVRLDEVIYHGPASDYMSARALVTTVPKEAVAHIPIEDVPPLLANQHKDVREAALKRLSDGGSTL